MEIIFNKVLGLSDEVVQFYVKQTYFDWGRGTNSHSCLIVELLLLKFSHI